MDLAILRFLCLYSFASKQKTSGHVSYYRRVLVLHCAHVCIYEALRGIEMAMSLEEIKLVVDLTMTKVDILKLKADHYNWSCFVDDDTRTQLENTIKEIDSMLEKLRHPENTPGE